MTARILTLSLLALSAISCKKEEIRTYRVVSDETQQPSSSSPTTQAAAPEILGTPKWAAPDTWQKQTPGQFQIELYKITETASLSISSFPGDAGGIPANINRWRTQVGLPSSDDPGGQTLHVETEGVTAQLFELKGDQQSILASIITLPKESWFFKLTCATSEIEAMREQFNTFLTTIEVATADDEQPQAEPAPTPAAPPYETPEKRQGIGLNVPEGWTKSQGSSMRVASFSIPGDGVPDGDVSVVPLMGESGSILENVNRWRAQVKLPALPSEDDPAIGTKKDGTAGTFLITHMVSEEPLFEDNKKGSISTAILKRGDTTWFFKITGEAELVAKHLEAFETFVLTAEIP